MEVLRRKMDLQYQKTALHRQHGCSDWLGDGQPSVAEAGRGEASAKKECDSEATGCGGISD